MKKFILIIALMILFNGQALAKAMKIPAVVVDGFSSDGSKQTLTVQSLYDYKLTEKEIVPAGITFNGRVEKVMQPKRGKRAGYLYLRAESYNVKGEGQTHIIKDKNAVAKVTKYVPKTKGELATSAGIGVAGLFIDNISYPINFVRGVITPYEGKNRFTSGIQKTYEESFFSYLSPGEDIELKAGDYVMLQFNYEVQDDDGIEKRVLINKYTDK